MLRSDASLLLLGSTDLTQSVAEAMVDAGVILAGVMSPPAEFRISYSSGPVRNSRFADMAAWCAHSNVPFHVYSTPDDIARVAHDTGPTAALLAGWYHMVPARTRALFSRGCVGVHASLLPRYRGGAPLNWAMLNGDSEAGVSLFELADGIDDGVLYDQRRFSISEQDYIGDVVSKAEALTIQMLRDVIPVFLSGRAHGRPQQGPPSYSLQRQPSDGAIDWRRSAVDIARLVRSVSRPYPGARTTLEGAPLVIWRAHVAADAPPVHGIPGQIVRLDALPGPAVVTGDGLLVIEEVEGSEGFNLEAFRRCHQRRLGLSGT